MQTKHVLLFLLLLSLTGCRSISQKRAEALFSEGSKISDKQIKFLNQYAREFGQIFTEQNRAQFPANRDSLNSRVQKILPLMDESLRLGNEATQKYEEASRLMAREQDQKGVALIAASFRKSVEIEQMLKQQALLVSDQTITDAKTFNEKFVHINELIQKKQKEKDDQFDEGKRLMLTK